MPPLLDLHGKTFGRLNVVGPHRRRGGVTYWRCECSCGLEGWVSVAPLRSGNTKSCGCLNEEQRRERKTTHGCSQTRLYKTWKRMRVRCNNPNNKDYYRYGGRGIGLCEEWDDFENFQGWALANGYQEGLSIDRVDNDGDYEPGNCCWVSSVCNAAKAARTLAFAEAEAIRTLSRLRFFRQAEIATLFGVSRSVVNRIVLRKTYRKPLEAM